MFDVCRHCSMYSILHEPPVPRIKMKQRREKNYKSILPLLEV